MAKTYTTNTRLPYFSEINTAGLAPLYLIDYLRGADDDALGITGRNDVSGVFGYWALASDDSPYNVWYMDYIATIDIASGWVYHDGGYGVRPVINLSI